MKFYSTHLNDTDRDAAQNMAGRFGRMLERDAAVKRNPMIAIVALEICIAGFIKIKGSSAVDRENVDSVAKDVLSYVQHVRKLEQDARDREMGKPVEP